MTTENIHTPTSDVEVQAQLFASCFEPNAYRLDEHFAWLSEEDRLTLARAVDRAIQDVFVEMYEDLYGPAER